MLHRPERILNGAGCHFRRSGAELHRVHVCVNAAGAQRKDGVAVHLGMHRTDGAGVAIVGAGSHAQGLRLGQHRIRGDHADGGILAGGGTDLQHFRDGRTAVEQMVAQHRLAVGQMAAGQYLISIGFVNVAAGVDRVLTMDLHANQIQGFFDVPVDALYASGIFVPYIKSLNIEDLSIAAPDMGGAKRANTYAKHLSAPIIISHKERAKANVVGKMTAIGDVKGRNVIIVDDMIDTAGTICMAADMLMEKGAKSVRAAITHPILSGQAYEKINASALQEVIVTDTIPLNPEKDLSKFKVMTVADIFANVIERVHNYKEISSIFFK